MPSRTSIKSTSLRLPEDLLSATQALAARQRKSVNALVIESIKRTVRDDEDEVLYDAFSLLGEDAESDVEFALQAQSEIVGHAAG
ncbi:MAG TPA: hypothetical protein VGM51_16310 [Armatimonadota bacterium]